MDKQTRTWLKGEVDKRKRVIAAHSARGHISLDWSIRQRIMAREEALKKAA